jgi:hypothetical protein
MLYVVLVFPACQDDMHDVVLHIYVLFCPWQVSHWFHEYPHFAFLFLVVHLLGDEVAIPHSNCLEFVVAVFINADFSLEMLRKVEEDLLLPKGVAVDVEFKCLVGLPLGLNVVQ